MDPLKFIFELVDQMTGPSRSITKELKAVEAQIKKTDIALQKSAIDKMAPGLQKQRAELGLQRDALLASSEGFTTLAEKASSARGAINALGAPLLVMGAVATGIGYEFAKSAVHVASFAEDNKVALEVVTGSQDAANRVLKDMINLAAHLPITDQIAMGAATRYMLAGFKEKDLANMVTAMSDVQALNPGRGLEAMNDFANLITRIKSGGLNARELMFLPQETHINPEAIRKELQAMGYVAMKTVQDMHLMAHAINPDDFIEATVRAISAMTGGKGIGNLSGKLSHTITGLLSTLEGREFALMIDLDTSPGYESLRGFLRNMVEVTDPNSELGREISQNIAGAFSDSFGTVFSELGGPNGPKKIAEIVRSDVIPAFKDFATVVGGIASVTMTIVSGWANLTRFLRGDTGLGVHGKTIEELTSGKQNEVNSSGFLNLLGIGKGSGQWSALAPDAQDRVRRLALKTGIGTFQSASDVVDGYSKSIRAGIPEVVGAHEDVAQAGIDASRDVLQIHSPSKVFERIGAFATAGYTRGVLGGMGEAQDALGGMVSAPAVGAFVARSGDGRQIVINMPINVDARGSDKDDANDIAKAVADAVPASLVQAFDMIATQYGNN